MLLKPKHDQTIASRLNGHPRWSCLRAVGVSFASPRLASPFQDIPAQHIKEIQSGEFFDLTKLLQALSRRLGTVEEIRHKDALC